MQRKTSTQVHESIEAKDVCAALEKVTTLASEDEKVLRMHHGARVAKNTPLARHGEGFPEVQDELLLMEMQLFRAMRQRQANRTAAPVGASRTKDKIVRALRRKR